MELRHLRYFVAVAEEGSLKHAAQNRLHTAQPSLSRQICDLEAELGYPLITRSVRGIQLTEAGRVFLDYARLALAQVEAGIVAARLAAQLPKPIFSIGFLVGHEVDCLPLVTATLQHLMPTIELRIFSNFSTTLASDLLRGTLDVAFLRREPEPDLEFRPVLQEKLVAILPRGHRLASRKAVDAQELDRETFIGISRVPHVLRGVVTGYVKSLGVDIVPRFEIDSFPMAISLVEAAKGVAILPASIEGFLPNSIVGRRLKGEQPTIELMVGFHKANTSSILRTFLSKLPELTEQIQSTARR